MNRLLRIAGLILALTPLAYPYGNLLKATEVTALWPTVAPDSRVDSALDRALRLPAGVR